MLINVVKFILFGSETNNYSKLDSIKSEIINLIK